jgi:hypothetical protein
MNCTTPLEFEKQFPGAGAGDMTSAKLWVLKRKTTKRRNTRPARI